VCALSVSQGGGGSVVAVKACGVRVFGFSFVSRTYECERRADMNSCSHVCTYVRDNVITKGRVYSRESTSCSCEEQCMHHRHIVTANNAPQDSHHTGAESQKEKGGTTLFVILQNFSFTQFTNHNISDPLPSLKRLELKISRKYKREVRRDSIRRSEIFFSLGLVPICSIYGQLITPVLI